MPQMRHFESLHIIVTTSAHYNTAKKLFTCSSGICSQMKSRSSVIPASLCLLSLPCLPWLPHRDNRPRSHPPHFALTAPMPTHHLLSQPKCGGLPPLFHRLLSLPIASGVGQGGGGEQVKSGNFNWSHRQF